MRDFKNKIPEEEVVQTIKAPKVKLNLLRLVSTCSCRVCSWLKDPCQFTDCKKALKPQDSLCFQSFRHMLIITNSIERAQGVIARVLRISKTIKDQMRERLGGYKDYSLQEMEVIIGAPLLAEDYKSADNFMLLLMQPQVKNMLNLKPVGRTGAKITQRGTSTLPKEFLDRPIPGPKETENLVSLSTFKEGGIYYTRGRLGKQLN